MSSGLRVLLRLDFPQTSRSLNRSLPRQFTEGVRQCRVGRRLLSTPASVSQTQTSTPPPPPPPHPELSRWRRALQTIGRVTLITIVTTGGTFYYITQKDRHPGSQLPHDPSKKNIVVVGSGWGSTAFLKSLDTAEYNVTVISPRNFFLFTPLLPSVAVGTLASKSILQPIRYMTRHKERKITVIEAQAKSVDPIAKTITFADESEVQGEVSSTTIPFDYLVYAVGAETQTFGIPGVKEHACFMKEIQDAERFKRRFMDCVESAGFPGQREEEIERLLHMAVVGGGPTGIEVSGELHDFLEDDLKAWYPELSNKIKITLIEALPSVLPMFSRELIDYTVSTFKESKIDILTGTMVKEIKDKSVVLQMPDKSIKEVPVGLVVWAGGNKARDVSVDLMSRLSDAQKNKRGITVDDHLRMAGTDGTIFALGDCTSSQYAPTAQVASQQGAYLARMFRQFAKRDALLEQVSAAKQEGTNTESLEKQLKKAENLRPFHYSHQGSLAYIGSEKAIADLEFFHHKFASGGVATFLFWRSAYLSTLFSMRNRVLVATDWLKVKLFGRDLVRD
ncbi:FAD/NAD-P-binding domain-containing protein [Lactarius akahatsu]|uniref:NADH:ubiquinone reductase (non-electrogenic) n=1 Tax=Lactarius akahatsu TaxID=416441 RepID=A0AAD4QD45_9AGAM|nr:FAD/NAD-P-binding domain-containing protein [Lactarius akahatsu]